MRLIYVLLTLFGLVWLGVATAKADHSPAVFGGGSGGPINTVPGTLLEPGQAIVSYRYDMLTLKTFSDQKLLDLEAAGFDVHSVDNSVTQFLTVAYGFSDRITLAVRQPYIDQNNIREPDGVGGVDSLGGTTGFGDTQFFAFGKIFDDVERGLFVSGLIGFDVPTGQQHSRSLLGDQFETEHQSGSGSVDPIIGLNLTKTFEKFSWHTSVSRIFNTAGAQQTTLGSVFNYNVAVVYRLGGGSFGNRAALPATAAYNPTSSTIQPVSYFDDDHAHSSSNSHAHEQDHDHAEHQHGPLVDLILELNGTSQNRHVVAGAIEESTGGHLLLISPGVRVTFHETWSFFVQGGLPIYQFVNGESHAASYRLTLGIAKLF